MLIQYLHTAKNGFSFENINRNKIDLLNAEAIIIVQMFGKPSTQQKDFDFGVGSAAGNY